MSNFQKLRESAEKATPGEWQQGFLHDGHEFIPSNNSGRVQKSDGTTFVPGSYEDAAFIAAANPSAILSLLDKIDAQEKEIAELHTSIAGAVQHGEQGWQRYEAANKMCLNQQKEIAGRNAGEKS